VDLGFGQAFLPSAAWGVQKPFQSMGTEPIPPFHDGRTTDPGPLHDGVERSTLQAQKHHLRTGAQRWSAGASGCQFLKPLLLFFIGMEGARSSGHDSVFRE
jgi:hypothetical protein